MAFTSEVATDGVTPFSPASSVRMLLTLFTASSVCACACWTIDCRSLALLTKVDASESAWASTFCRNWMLEGCRAAWERELARLLASAMIPPTFDSSNMLLACCNRSLAAVAPAATVDWERYAPSRKELRRRSMPTAL